ncbi:HlyD family type I secretion periplasmic adaptor subunit [Roseospira goensis]|uniref:Membrane fusion protein (MFP) family protein n=1 Tax=Roseospira goensis TaxID=391922 RepID=A0A7W6RZ52_9PROT|nr:HlyD family type I secretion periplasmic adaptor subunit [Roseospira goensis]MBB4285731.1 HlyD family secretion protein/epimerase transport system membrane fusion protein [Roseospira goensis]
MSNQGNIVPLQERGLPARTDAARPAADPDPPTNAKPVILLGLMVVLVMFGGLGTWAATAPLDSAVIAPGTVIVESNRKTIQHLEGGIVKEILVDEGDVVQAGDVLVRLDPTKAAAVEAVNRKSLNEAMALEARLVAEQRDAEDITFPEELLERADDPDVAEIIADQREQFRERKRSLDGQVAILRQRIQQFRQEIAGLEAQHDSKLRQRDIFREELVGLRELYEKGYYPRTRILAMEREVANLEGTIGSTLADIARAEKGIGEAELQIIQTRQKFREEVVAQLREVRNEIGQLREKVVVARDTLDRIDVRAPLAGTVQNLQVHTENGVIRPGDAIMEIVPLDDRLVIEGQVSPTDIDAVHPGLEAEVRLSALNMRTTPIILGEVTTVSRDRIVNERDNTAYFRIEVIVPDEELAKLGDQRLTAGMPADVVVKIGERTMLDYIVKPMTDYFAKAFTEQ